MAMHHVPVGMEIRVVGPAKADITGDLEAYMKVKPFVLSRLPVLQSLNPTSAQIGGEPVTLECVGQYFMPESVIVFNGGVEPTTFVDGTKLTTTVVPQTAGTPGDYAVTVRTFTHETAPLTFTFTEPAAEGMRRKR